MKETVKDFLAAVANDVDKPEEIQQTAARYLTKVEGTPVADYDFEEEVVNPAIEAFEQGWDNEDGVGLTARHFLWEYDGFDFCMDIIEMHLEDL